MSVDIARFGPGALVRARGREWVVVSSPNDDTLRVRPLAGSEEDETVIFLPLEAEPVVPATFPPPSQWQQAGHEAALLLRDSLLLSLRRGAGPFRSFGHISVEPRAYQLVPLLMALKLDPIRLLIADDVGVGKTIEAGLIVRELLDRGDIAKFTVLCPPHLVGQWVTELERSFHLKATAVTAVSANRLERDLPASVGIFDAHPFTVVSLDYIKSDSRRARFLQTCPELVIVDEAHTCSSTGRGRHQRYELLRDVAADSKRQLVMLTAVPHSGDDEAFYRLLGLLDPSFERLRDLESIERDALRETLARHFVQRRRPDIAEWQDGQLFPERETAEITYKLTGKWQQLLEDILDHCATIVAQAGEDERRRRLNFWGTLALMRCVASSPAAAVQALTSRANPGESPVNEDASEELLFDGSGDALPDDDVEPSLVMGGHDLDRLIDQAEELAGLVGDPKLRCLTDHLHELVKGGFSPVVFCRFIATAHYLKMHLSAHFPQATVGVVTGELTAHEREQAVAVIGEAQHRMLVATDCLSEGVNLQEWFDAVVHYDLSWNPTRHEQREGRVDRFGQTSKLVRSTLMYGENNPVDGAVLKVILRKGEEIRKELGVPVPLPDEGHKLTQALMKAVLLRGNRADRRQLSIFDIDELPETQKIETAWKDVRESAKRNRTVFAQRRLRPDDVLPEWRKTLEAIGGADDVWRFTDRALARLGSGLERHKEGFRAPLDSLPPDVRERLEVDGLTGNVKITFEKPAVGCLWVRRSHPLVAILADTLLERTFANVVCEDVQEPSVLGRTGCWIASVKARTTIVLLRLRHQLTTGRGSGSSISLVEEATGVAWGAESSNEIYTGGEALSLLALPPRGDPPPNVRERECLRALEHVHRHTDTMNRFAEQRAQDLLADHRRVREAAGARGSYAVKSLLPPDLVAVYVLLPPVL